MDASMATPAIKVREPTLQVDTATDLGDRHLTLLDVALVIPTVGIYLLLAVHDLTLPGVYGDEMIQLAPLASTLGHSPQVSLGGVPATLLTIAGHPFSLMSMPYMGALKALLFLPIAARFGESVYSVRLFTVCIAAAFVALTYVFTLRAFSRPAAFVATVLVALDQSFIFRTKVDWGPNAISLTCKMAALLALVTWWQSRRPSLLLVGGLALGLGLYNKADFSWVLAALLLATAIVYPRELREAANVRNVVAFGSSFLAGAAVFIWYNLRWKLASFQLGNPDHIAWWHPDIFWTAVQQRATLLVQLLNGTSMDYPLGISPADRRPFAFGTPMFLAFIVAVGIAIVISFGWFRVDLSLRRRIQWLLLTMALFFCFCALTPAGDGHHHMLNIYPFPHVLIAVVLTDVMALIGARLATVHRAVPRLVTGGAVLFLVVCDLVMVGNSYRQVEATGGAGRWSDSIYRVASDVGSRRAGVQVHVMDWGLIWRLTVLLNGDVRGIDEPWPALTDKSSRASEEAQLILDPRAEYVVDSPGTAAFPQAWNDFERYAAQHGEKARLIKTYSQRDGVPTTQVYRLSGRAASRPGTGASNHGVTVNVLQRGASLTVNMAPGRGFRRTAILEWNVGSAPSGRLLVSKNGGAATLFAEGSQGTGSAPWIVSGNRYAFRLYAGRRLVAIGVIDR